jgi:hypothetical protein
MFALGISRSTAHRIAELRPKPDEHYKQSHTRHPNMYGVQLRPPHFR